MKTNQHIKIRIGDVEVEGVIFYLSPRDISVRITKPYAKLNKALHVPHFDPRSFVGAHADETARRLLTELYVSGKEQEERSVLARRRRSISGRMMKVLICWGKRVRNNWIREVSKWK